MSITMDLGRKGWHPPAPPPQEIVGKVSTLPWLRPENIQILHNLLSHRHHDHCHHHHHRYCHHHCHHHHHHHHHSYHHHCHYHHHHHHHHIIIIIIIIIITLCSITKFQPSMCIFWLNPYFWSSDSNQGLNSFMLLMNSPCAY